jgi:hypothetical protein
MPEIDFTQRFKKEKNGVSMVDGQTLIYLAPKLVHVTHAATVTKFLCLKNNANI